MSSNSSRRRRAARRRDVRALAVAVLELRLGLVGLVILVGVVVLGQAEVDERAVPGVPEGHIEWNLARLRRVLLQVVRRERAAQRYRRVPIRTIVAPSSTATAKSWVVPIDSSRRPRSPRQRRAARRTSGRLSSRVLRRTAASSSARRRGTGSARGTRRGPPGATPLLRLLPRDVDLDEDLGLRRSPWRSSCASTESLATEWIQRTCGSTCRTLRLCRWPMKSNVRRSPQRSCLATRSCARFSPASVMPGVGEHADLVERDVLHGGEDLDVRRVAPGARAGGGDLGADRPRGSRGPRSASRPWISSAMRRPPGARRPRPRGGGTRTARRRADRAQPGVVDLGHARLLEDRARDGGEVGVRAAPRARRRARRTPRGPRRRPRSSRRRAPGPIAARISRRAELAQRGDARLARRRRRARASRRGRRRRPPARSARSAGSRRRARRRRRPAAS